VTPISGVCSLASPTEPTTPNTAKIDTVVVNSRGENRSLHGAMATAARSDTGPGPDSGLAGRGRGGRAPYVDAENCGNSATSLEIVAAVATSSSASGLRGVPAGNPRALSAALMAGINGADMIASISG